MKILHVIQRYWPYIGGSERQFQEFSERLVRDGHQVTVFTTDAWDLELFWNPRKKRIAVAEEEHNGVLIRRFPVRHVLPFPLTYPIIRRIMLALSDLPLDTTPLLFPLAALTPWIPALRQTLSQTNERYDLVAGMNIVFDALLAPAAAFARRIGVPFIVHPLTHLGEDNNPRVRRYYTMRHQIRLLRNADALILQNVLEEHALIALGLPPEKMHIVGSGVNPHEVLGGDAERFRRQYGISGPIVAFLGTAAYDKGAHHSIEAMKVLWQEGVQATLVMAGPTMDHFMAYYNAQPASVRARCRVLGFIPEDEKRDLLAACDVLVLPSRTDSFGIVFLEAWLYNKPVIGARAGGIPAVISDGEDGFLIPFGDVAALAARIRQLLTDSGLARRMGERGHRKTLATMTWDHRYAMIRQVYESMATSVALRRNI